MADAMIFLMDELAGKEHGPYSLDEIQTMIYRKKLKKKHLVRKSDYSKWFKAEDLLGKVFDTVDQLKIDEKQAAMEEKTRKKRQSQREKELEREARDKIANTEPYEISESDNEILSAYLAALRDYGNRLKALKEDPENAELKQELIDNGRSFAKLTQRARAALPNEPIKEFDNDDDNKYHHRYDL